MGLTLHEINYNFSIGELYPSEEVSPILDSEVEHAMKDTKNKASGEDQIVMIEVHISDVISSANGNAESWRRTWATHHWARAPP
jgi:hypothetical protein